MIHTVTRDGFKHNYSDLGLQIRKVGTDEIYEETYDVINSTNTYEETDLLRVEVKEILESITEQE